MATATLLFIHTKKGLDPPTAALITGAVGSLFCIIGAILRDRRKRLLKSGIRVEGEVSGIDYDPGRNDSMGIYYPIIQYVTTNGEEITQKYNFGTSRKTYNQGDSVAVIYDPESPSTFILNNKTSRLGPWICILMGLIFVLLAIVMYVFQ